MKKIVLHTFLLMVISIGNAQTFTNTPSDTIQINLPNNFYTELPIYQINQTSDTLNLGIEVVYNDVPAAWDGMICVFGQCLGSILPVSSTATQSPVWGTNQGMVRLTVNPFGDNSAATLRVYCYDVNFPNDGDTLTWILNQSATSIDEPLRELVNLSIYPNPVRGKLQLDISNFEIDEVRVVSLEGKVLMSRQSLNNSTVEMNVAALSGGLYMVQLLNRGALIGRAKFIVE